MPAAPLGFFGNLMRNSGGFFVPGLDGLRTLTSRNPLFAKKIKDGSRWFIREFNRPHAPFHRCVIRGVFLCPKIRSFWAMGELAD